MPGICRLYVLIADLYLKNELIPEEFFELNYAIFTFSLEWGL